MGISRVVTKEVEFHVTPLEKVTIRDGQVRIELDDIYEYRWELLFSPYQAVNITTIDCVSAQDFFSEDSYDTNRIFHRYLLAIENSKWIENLKSKQVDISSNFLNKSTHYVLPLQDSVIEVLAWNFSITKL